MKTPTAIERSEEGDTLVSSPPTQGHNLTPTLSLTYISHLPWWGVGVKLTYLSLSPTKHLILLPLSKKTDRVSHLYKVSLKRKISYRVLCGGRGNYCVCMIWRDNHAVHVSVGVERREVEPFRGIVRQKLMWVKSDPINSSLIAI